MRKLLKKVLALSLCVCMVVGMATGASAETNNIISNNGSYDGIEDTGKDIEFIREFSISELDIPDTKVLQTKYIVYDMYEHIYDITTKDTMITIINRGNNSGAGALTFWIEGEVQAVDAGRGVQFACKKGKTYAIYAKANWWTDNYILDIR